MHFTVTRVRLLLEAANPDAAKTRIKVNKGDQLERLAEDGDFSKVRVIRPDGSRPEGFILTAHLAEFKPEPKPIDKTDFAHQALIAARSFGVNAHYLIALAHVETGIEDAFDTESGRRGPFLIDQEYWDAILADPPAELADIRSTDLTEKPHRHCLVMGHETAVATAALSEILKEPDSNGFIPGKRLPTAAELYLAHRMGLKNAKEVLALDTSLPVDLVLTRIFADRDDTAEFAQKVIESEARFLKIVGAPATVQQALEKVTVAFDEGVKIADGLIDQLPLDMREVDVVATGGTAPWFAIAEQEMERGVVEDRSPGGSNPRISEYHRSVRGAPNRSDDVAWCAAFVTWCMEETDNALVRDANIRSALAADWIRWAKPIAEPVKGAVVVLEPLVSGASGHVGFFVDKDGDHFRLLGGNQGNPQGVNMVRFPLRKVRGYRWLSLPASGAGTGVPAGDTGVPAGGAIAGDRIAEVNLKNWRANPTANQTKMKDLILLRFAERGFGKIQQVAALANAIAESSLNPKAHNTAGEDSVGLFQCNRNGGHGTGFTVAQLKDPEINIRIIADIAATKSGYVNATTLAEAVEVFVRKVEIPANPSQKVRERQDIANKLIS